MDNEQLDSALKLKESMALIQNQLDQWKCWTSRVHTPGLRCSSDMVFKTVKSLVTAELNEKLNELNSKFEAL